MAATIVLLGELDPTFEPHAATDAAIAHSAAALGAAVRSGWTSTADVDSTLFDRCAGLWVAPGSPYRDMDRTLWAIREARQRGVPCFGTCGGFQHMIIEYARHVLGYKDAQHAEYDPYASRLFVTGLACALAGRAMTLRFTPGSQVAEIYGRLEASERYYCNFGVNPDVLPLLTRGPLRITGADAEGEVRVIELPGHPFFVGTLFVPQSRSTPQTPHPLVTAFLRAVVARAAVPHP